MSPSLLGQDREAVVLSGVPYIHQYYDTVDSFAGGASACNATAALMAIQYYERLPADPVVCNRGGSHVTDYGIYVSEIYTYNGHTYDVPSSAVWGQASAGFHGGFGYFLQGSASDGALRAERLSDYIEQHRVESWVDADVFGERGFTKICAEIDAGHPVVVLAALAPAGHYITCIGYVPGEHTLVFNDPAGNVAEGYPNWGGAGVRYDWPGWSHGHPSLVAVPRIIYARAVPVTLEVPVFTYEPGSLTVAERATCDFMVSVTPTANFQWQGSSDQGTTWQNAENGTVYAGATSGTLTIAAPTMAMNGRQYRCLATNPAGTRISTVATLTVLGNSHEPTQRFVNLSARAYCSTGDNVTIGGFVVSGPVAKRVLIRAVGPSLTAQGIISSEVLLDPTIEVHHGSAVVATNDNWGENPNAEEITGLGARIGANALLANDATSSALLLSLPPGVYSFVVRGRSDTSGIVLLEVYDADSVSTGSNFVNIATRAYATTGNGVAIGGFVITGSSPKRVLMRAVGPSLTAQALNANQVLLDPTIELHHGNDTIATNDDWGTNENTAAIVSTGARIGATPFESTDTKSSALLLTLDPGVYSFIAKGKNDTSGIVLVEVYAAD